MVGFGLFLGIIERIANTKGELDNRLCYIVLKKATFLSKCGNISQFVAINNKQL